MAPAGPTGARSPPSALCARLEILEDRLTPSTLTVTSAADDSSGGTLRSVIGAASPGSTIVFAPSLIGKTITLSQGELNVNKSLTIVGPGASYLTISGNSTSRVFDVSNGATVTIDCVTIAKGSFTGNDSPGTPVTNYGGGGILNQAGSTLTLNQDVLTGNTANALNNTVDVFGGGLLNEGSATVNSCTFRGNQAVGGGGGSFFGGSVGGGIDDYGGGMLTVANSTFTNNQALAAAGFWAMAGAIGNDAGVDLAHPSTALISNSTFTNNLTGGVPGAEGATGQGGALNNQGTGATMTVSNCSFTGNKAVGGGTGANSGNGNGEGGAILNQALSLLMVTNCSFLNNEALGGPGTEGIGGAIQNGDYNQSAPFCPSDGDH